MVGTTSTLSPPAVCSGGTSLRFVDVADPTLFVAVVDLGGDDLGEEPDAGAFRTTISGTRALWCGRGQGSPRAAAPIATMAALLCRRAIGYSRLRGWQ